MSYASLAAPALVAPLFPAIRLPVRAIRNALVLALQSLGLAASLWLLLAAPGFLTDRTALQPVAGLHDVH